MEKIKKMDSKLPFSLACFLCAERKGNIFGKLPDCESMNATYTHSEKREIILEVFPNVNISKLSVSGNPCM